MAISESLYIFAPDKNWASAFLYKEASLWAERVGRLESGDIFMVVGSKEKDGTPFQQIFILSKGVLGWIQWWEWKTLSGLIIPVHNQL